MSSATMGVGLCMEHVESRDIIRNQQRQTLCRVSESSNGHSTMSSEFKFTIRSCFSPQCSARHQNLDLVYSQHCVVFVILAAVMS